MRSPWFHPSLAVGIDTGMTSRFRYWHAAAVLAIGIVISGLASLIVYHDIMDRQRHQFREQAGIQAQALGRYAESSVKFLGVLAAYFSGSNGVDNADFERISRSLHMHHPEIQALSWNPVVLPIDRARFELQARERIAPDYRIWRLDSLGKREPPYPDSVCVPVAFLWPRKGNEAALGYDIASEPNRRDAVGRARGGRGAAVTAKVTLVQKGESHYGILFLHPVFVMRWGG